MEKKGIKVFLPDLPGFGENSLLSRPWTIKDYVIWVKDFVEKNHLDRFFLLGHSFGGNIAVNYVLGFPEGVEKLILVSPALIRIKDKKKEIFVKFAKLFKKLSFLPFYSPLKKVFYRFFVKSDYPDTKGFLRETYLKIIKEDFSEKLFGISVPTILIWGEKDNITPFEHANFIKEKISGAELKILPGVGHVPRDEAPELLVEKILESL